MRRIDLYITEPQYKSLAAMRDEEGWTISEMVRRAVDNYLAEREKHRAAEEDRRARRLEVDFIETMRRGK